MHLKVCDLRAGVSRGDVYLNTDMHLKVCDLRAGVSRGDVYLNTDMYLKVCDLRSLPCRPRSTVSLFPAVRAAYSRQTTPASCARCQRDGRPPPCPPPGTRPLPAAAAGPYARGRGGDRDGRPTRASTRPVSAFTWEEGVGVADIYN